MILGGAGDGPVPSADPLDTGAVSDVDGIVAVRIPEASPPLGSMAAELVFSVLGSVLAYWLVWLIAARNFIAGGHADRSSAGGHCLTLRSAFVGLAVMIGTCVRPMQRTEEKPRKSSPTQRRYGPVRPASSARRVSPRG
ncbi:hypothetical protein [Mycobacterium lepromatosis]|uniref:hypothetical protein n=1 Tax=Mycobacterium lepromatosis TaxID=480418 RepID=UPI0005F775F5|nr:hypothetical protein [Mycobacterium lepromatosis]